MQTGNKYLDGFNSLLQEFYNQCHGEDDGKFCEGPDGPGRIRDNVQGDVPQETQEQTTSQNIKYNLVKLQNGGATVIKSANRALAAIDKVHDIPDKFPKATLSVGGGDADGSYSSGDDTISINPKHAGREITFVHEMGHHLSLGEEGNYSLNQFLDKADRIPSLRNIIDKIYESDTYSGLKERNAGKKDGYDSYLLDERESFARAYAQWIAVRSGDKLLLKQMKANRDRNPNFQWYDDDFTQIASAFDKHFDSHENITSAGTPTEFHGDHNQKSHGNWAGTEEEEEQLRALLTKDSLGIPRSGMPQLTKRNESGERVSLEPEFKDYLKSQGVQTEQKTVRADSLKPTQDELDIERVRALVKNKNTDFKNAFISQDNYILDGHHLWGANFLANKNLNVTQANSPIRTLIELARQFNRANGIKPRGINNVDQKETLALRASAAFEDFHLIGQHDQSSHGSWATGESDEPGKRGPGRPAGLPRTAAELEADKRRGLKGKRKIRPITVAGNVAYVPLTDDPNGPKAIIDSEDIDKVDEYTWTENKVSGKPVSKTKGELVRLHQLVTGKRGMDHINGDPLDNRKANLREVTQRQNTLNKGPQANNKLGEKGIDLLPSGSYRVRIKTAEGKVISKTYKTIEEAREARRLAALEYHGEHAYENRPEANG